MRCVKTVFNITRKKCITTEYLSYFERKLPQTIQASWHRKHPCTPPNVFSDLCLRNNPFLPDFRKVVICPLINYTAIE